MEAREPNLLLLVYVVVCVVTPVQIGGYEYLALSCPYCFILATDMVGLVNLRLRPEPSQTTANRAKIPLYVQLLT